MSSVPQQEVEASWNVMANAKKSDFVLRRNGRVHLNRRGRQFSRLLAAEVCATAVEMLDTPCSEVVWRVLATHSIRQFPLHFLTRASPCAITLQMVSTSYHLQHKMQLTPFTVPGLNHFIPCLLYGTLWTGILQPVASSTIVSLLRGSWGALPQGQLYYINNCPTRCNTVYLLFCKFTCFGCQPHPPSGVHKTVTTTSGTGHIFVQLPPSNVAKVGR